MADMRLRGPEPPPGAPRIQHQPGLGDELLSELAPLLAEEGIDLSNPGAVDRQLLQDALNRAVERRNMELFSPVGRPRQLAVAALRKVALAIAEGDTKRAGSLLDNVVPESLDNRRPTVSSCIGIALGLLDDWLSGQDPAAPRLLRHYTKLPTGHWYGERAATDILVLARKGRAFGSLGILIARQGGRHVLFGSALALGVALDGWAQDNGVPAAQLARKVIR